MVSPLEAQRIAVAKEYLALGQNYIDINGHIYQLTGVINSDGTLGYVDLGAVPGAPASSSSGAATAGGAGTAANPNSLFIGGGINPVPLIHPNAVPAPILTPPPPGAGSGIGNILTGISTPGMMGVQYLSGRHKGVPTPGSGDNIVQFGAKGEPGGGPGGGAGLQGIQNSNPITQLQHQIANLQKVIPAQQAYDNAFAKFTQNDDLIANLKKQISDQFGIDPSKLTKDFITDTLLPASTNPDLNNLASQLSTAFDQKTILGIDFEKFKADLTSVTNQINTAQNQSSLPMLQHQLADAQFQFQQTQALGAFNEAQNQALFSTSDNQWLLARAELQNSGAKLKFDPNTGLPDAKTQLQINNQIKADTNNWIASRVSAIDPATASQELQSAFDSTHLNDPMYTNSQAVKDWQNYGNEAPIPTPSEALNYKPSAQEILNQQQIDAAQSIKDGFPAYQKSTNSDWMNLKDQMLNSAELKFGIEAAAAAGAGYGLFASLYSMAKNGKASVIGVIGSITSMAGLVGLLHAMHKALMSTFVDTKLFEALNQLHFLKFLHLGSVFQHLTGNWGMMGIIAGIMLLAILLGMHQPDPAQVAAETLNAQINPTVWNPNGQVIFLTAGLTMATLGLNLSPTAPMMQTMTLSQAAATESLAAAGASSVPTDSTRYADVFVQQGGVGQPTRVVWLTSSGTDSKGRAIETMTVETLKPGLQFAASQPTNFIPFFIPGPGGKVTPNPQVVQNLTAQQHLLQCADGTWVSDATLCASAAGATSHVSPSGGL